jgi:thioredoxin reductase (NADPH)
MVMNPADERTESEVRRRYGTEYEVLRVDHAETGRTMIDALHRDGKEVALVLASLDLPDSAGEDFLAWIRSLHDNTKRGLVVSWGDIHAKSRVLRAMSLGETESWSYAPVAERDEQFHRTVSELLEEWDRWNGIDLAEIVVVGQRVSPEVQSIRDTLLRYGHPYRFCDLDSPEGEHILGEAGIAGEETPLVRLPDGVVLSQPSRSDLASVLGVETTPPGSDYEVAIIGAGPAGLSAATYASSEGMSTVLIEQESVGGQAGSSALIRNYLGFPRGISGPELASRAYQQAWLFGTDLVYGVPVTTLERRGRRLVIRREDGSEISAGAVIIATGVGYRQLGIESIDSLTGAGVFYGAAMAEATVLANEPVAVVGGGNSSGQAALHLAKYAAQVIMLVRGHSFAESMSDYLIREIERNENIEVHFDAELVAGTGSGRLESITFRNIATGQEVTAPLAALFIFIGMSPRTDWLPDAIRRDQWGFIETGGEHGAGHAALGLETSMPGVFAVGDVRHGSIKRVASAVGEGSISIPMVREYLASLRDEGTTSV